MKEISISEITRQIANAFDDLTCPESDDIFIASGGHMFDLEQATNQLKIEHWNSLSLDVLIQNRDRMSYFTTKAFQFYIPAFLLAIIEKPTEVDVMLDNTLFALKTSNHYQGQILLSQRVALFSEEQIKAIVTFFENYTLIFPPDKWSFTELDRREIEYSINYWQSKLRM